MKNMKKKLFGILLALALCLSLLPATALADTDTHADHCVCGATHTAVGDHKTESVITDWQEWTETTSLPTTTGNYYLKENVTISSRQTIQKDNTVTLCLNGKTITAVNTNSDTEYILVEGTLNLTDCTGDGKITSADYSKPGNKVLVVSSKSGSTLNLYGGTITKINAGNASKADPYTHEGDGDKYNGGGVRNEGTFNMYGGAITENKTRSGGGVYNQGTFTMYGGTISKNNAAGNAGGGVFNTGGGTFNLCGGTISGNIAKQTTGNDVHNWNGGKINANGGTVEGAVYNQKGTITTTDEATSATTFNGAVTNGDDTTNQGIISGGTFNGTVTNNKTISGGTFNGTVTNKSGSTVSGSVTNNGAFVFEGTSTNSAAITGTGYVQTGDTVTDNSGAALTGTVTVSTAAALTHAVNASGVSTIVLADNITLSESDKDATLVIPEGKTLTIDLNEKTISAGAVGRVIQVKGDLTITGNGIIESATVTQQSTDTDFYDQYQVIDVDGTNAKLTMASGTIKAYGDNGIGLYGISVKNGATVILGDDDGNGPTVEAFHGAVAANNTKGPATVIIKGGTYKQTAIPDSSVTSQDEKHYAAFFASASGTYTISGGTFSGYYAVSSPYNRVEQTLTISGGDFTGSKAVLSVDAMPGQVGTVARTISISGGTFSGSFAVDSTVKTTGDDKASITGGTFSSDPGAYAANGYIGTKNADGTYGVVPTAGGLGAGTYTSDPSASLAPGFYVSAYGDGYWVVSPRPGVSLPVGSVNVSGSANGSVSVDRDDARQGSIVTVTVTPANGSALDSLTVVDANGNAIPVTHVGGNKYSFVMPATDVTVRATFTDGTSTGFVDVPADKYFYNAVNWAVANGITSGTDATHFSPYASCTRGQLVTFLWRAAGCPAAKATENAFGDVKETSSFYKAILWAAENGIVTGYNDGTFKPNAAVSRQQTAAILYRYAKFAGMDVSVGEDTNILSFNDALSVSEYAISAFQWATGAQVITGNGTNLLPYDTCTRSQIVTMLYRLLAK